MSAQFSEILIYQGKELTLCAEPLGPFLEFSANPLRFQYTSTALWRGYVGTWAIENDRLYLVKLSVNVVTDGQEQDIGLDALFPDYPDGVFAHWFTGELRCPSGALLNYVHGGFASTYERDLYFRVQRGVVLEARTVVNGQAEPDASQEYTLAAVTTFGKSKKD